MASAPLRIAAVKVGYACNNNCWHCVVAHHRQRGVPDRTLAELRKELVEAAANGATLAIITGGEPTIRDDIIDVLRAAKDLGLSVLLQTNGRMLAYPDLAKSVAELVDEVEVAVHGDTAALHDAITCAPGGFEQTMGGIRNLVEAGARVLTNTVITRLNADRLSAIARVLVAAGVHQVQFANVHPDGNALDDAEAVVPRLSELARPLAEAIDVVEGAGRTAYYEAVPFCAVPGREANAIELHLPAEVELREPGYESRDFLPERRSGKVKGPRCSECTLEPRCEGVWNEYARLYGTDELRPVRRQVRLPGDRS